MPSMGDEATLRAREPGAIPGAIPAAFASPLPAASAAGTPRLTVRIGTALVAAGPDGAPCQARGRKGRALLALLALASPAPVPRSRICALLWSRSGAGQARASLRQCLHELHVGLGEAAPLLVAERDNIALRGPGLSIVLPAHDGADAPELADLDGIDPMFDRFLAERRQAWQDGAVSWAEAVLAAGEGPADRLAAATALLALDATHEGAWRAAMQARAAQSGHDEALALYGRCVTTLAERAGTVPSAETRALAEALRRTGTRSARSSRREGMRVGVAPLRVGAGGAELAGLSLGLADEITSALARFRWLFLIASPSMAAVAGSAPEAAGARWEALDLDFLLDGTLQQGGQRVRVNLRLLDMRAVAGAGMPMGEVVWSARFEREADDLLTLQDEIAAEAVAQIDPQLIRHASGHASGHATGRETRRGAAGTAQDPTAYALVLRAIPALYQLEEAAFLAAGEALERAVALDPGSAAAHAWLAYWHVFLVGQGWNGHAIPPLARDAAMVRAGALAARAVRLDPEDARALTIAGHVRAFLHRDVDGAMDLHAQALRLNPNLPLAWAFAGLAESYRGRHEAAIAHIAEARRLSPFDPNAFFYDTALMVPHLLLGHFGEVVALGRRAAAMNPTLSSTFKLMLSALGHLGAAAEAAQVRARLLRLEPGYTLAQAAARSTFRRAEDEAVFLEGLRRAGLPKEGSGSFL